MSGTHKRLFPGPDSFCCALLPPSVLRWLIGATLVAGSVLFLFQEDVRKGLGEEGAEVTKRSLEDKRVQVTDLKPKMTCILR